MSARAGGGGDGGGDDGGSGDGDGGGGGGGGGGNDGGSCHFLRVFTSRARIHALAAARAEPCSRYQVAARGAILAIPAAPGRRVPTGGASSRFRWCV